LPARPGAAASGVAFVDARPSELAQTITYDGRMGYQVVERDRELDTFRRLLAGARAGEGAAVLVQGPAGIGKTALLEAGARLAVDCRVLLGCGGDLERELSFGLMRELLEPVLRSAPAAQRRRWLSGAAAAATAVIGEPVAGASDDASIAYGLYWLVSALAAERPLVLVADDLHWCDRPSLRFLIFLARRIRGLPVALLLASRPPSPGLPGLLTELAAIDGVTTLALDPLSTEAAARVVAEHSFPSAQGAFVRACHSATGGNPLLLHELLETARDEGVSPDAQGADRVHTLAGPRLRRAVVGRLGRLSSAAGDLARAVAILGDGCELRHAAELARLTPDAAAAELPGLVAAGVLADRPRLAFRHPLQRIAVYDDRAKPVRAAEHARAAALLWSAGEEPETVAAHLLAAASVRESWAPSVLTAAATRALERGSPESAVRYLRRALDGPVAPMVRAALVRSHGNALVRLGDPAGAAVLHEALELAPDDRTRHEIVDESVDALVATGRPSQARRLILDALDGGEIDPDTHTELTGRLAILVAAFGPGPGEAQVRTLRRRAQELDAASAADRYAAGSLAALAAVVDGTAAEASELAHKAVNDEFWETDIRAGRPSFPALASLAAAGEVQSALAAAGRAVDIFRTRGSVLQVGLGLGWRARIHALAEDIGAAETDARAALRVLAETRPRDPAVGVIASLAWALIERGALEEAGVLLDQAPTAAGWNGAAVSCSRARLRLAQHEPGAALADLAAVESAARAAGWRSSAVFPWRALAVLARLGTGRADEARTLAREELAEAERFGVELEIGRALRLVAHADGGKADDPHLIDAVTILRGSGSELELARALVDQGSALRRAGERSRSREPLREGMELAHRRGATGTVERARIELRASGARPRSVFRSGVDALTPSEHRVASLAADGLANAEIAQELFVTVRTVEMHLTASYRKLDVTSRADLRAALGDSEEQSR
jgi:DNA-binding CsgD family transcriptional regulator